MRLLNCKDIGIVVHGIVKREVAGRCKMTLRVYLLASVSHAALAYYWKRQKKEITMTRINSFPALPQGKDPQYIFDDYLPEGMVGYVRTARKGEIPGHDPEVLTVYGFYLSDGKLKYASSDPGKLAQKLRKPGVVPMTLH